jgi:hypothetical protein
VWIARADDFAAGSAERAHHPNRSARSADGGKTWDSDRLGVGGDIDGEYYVRLFLEQYRPTGGVRLPVLDVANLASKPVAPPVTSVGSVRVRVEAEAGRATVRARTGTTLAPSAATWSDWQELANGELREPRGRYVEVAVELSTTDPLQTPRLKRVTVEASPKRPADWTTRLKVLESHNEEIIRSSIPFAYEPFDHPRLKELRTRHKLDDVVKGAKSELKLIERLARWSAQQWEKGHLKDAYPAWDALEILKPHADGKPVGGFCQQYNLVFLQACESFGIPGRCVSIGAGDHEGKIKGGGHEVVEVWSNEFRKWIYVDGNCAWYAVDHLRSVVPLSLWELRERQLTRLRDKLLPRPIDIHYLSDEGRRWIGLDGWPPFLELRLIPRSNFLAQKSPLPLNQGMRGWFWTGHHVWTDPAYPASLIYGNRVSVRRNWEWTLNQARYALEATDTPGVLRVELDTETPGFDTFVAAIDGQEARPVSSGFLWKLHPGKNRLEVRPRNRAGRAGVPSWIVLEYR